MGLSLGCPALPAGGLPWGSGRRPRRQRQRRQHSSGTTCCAGRRRQRQDWSARHSCQHGAPFQRARDTGQGLPEVSASQLLKASTAQVSPDRTLCVCCVLDSVPRERKGRPLQFTLDPLSLSHKLTNPPPHWCAAALESRGPSQQDGTLFAEGKLRHGTQCFPD